VDPFDVLGLDARADLTDDDVRAAWRRIATATHPDREDGGDPARYAHAADAYARLRTSWDRSEALADRPQPRARTRRGRLVPRSRLRSAAPRRGPVRGAPRRGPVRGALRRGRGAPRRVRAGILLVRATSAVAVCWVAYVTAGWVPATAAIMTGAATWLLVTSRRDLPSAPRFTHETRDRRPVALSWGFLGAIRAKSPTLIHQSNLRSGWPSSGRGMRQGSRPHT
jgi:hypothetical protein